MTISFTPAPTLPSLNDPANFNSRALALFSWLAGTHIAEQEGLEAADFFSVMASLTDATPGMVLLNGAHGLGSRDSSAIVVSDGHADLPTGFYAGGGGGAVNFPPNANYRPFLNLTRRIGPDDYRQVRIFFGAGNVPIIRYSDDKGVTWEEENTLYGRRNLLGTVSQAAGVPTGAVIERGSNASGEYVRFADGTQICWTVISAGSITGNGDGSSSNPYRTSSFDGSWAAAFVDDPVAEAIPLPPFDNFSVNQTLAIGHVRRVTSNSYFGVLAARPSGQSATAVNFDIMIKAIGRWF